MADEALRAWQALREVEQHRAAGRARDGGDARVAERWHAEEGHTQVPRAGVDLVGCIKHHAVALQRTQYFHQPLARHESRGG